MKKSSSVSEKCPSTPATANAMPAKRVKVSPTNTLEGYLEEG